MGQAPNGPCQLPDVAVRINATSIVGLPQRTLDPALATDGRVEGQIRAAFAVIGALPSGRRICARLEFPIDSITAATAIVAGADVTLPAVKDDVVRRSALASDAAVSDDQVMCAVQSRHSVLRLSGQIFSLARRAADRSCYTIGDGGEESKHGGVLHVAPFVR